MSDRAVIILLAVIAAFLIYLAVTPHTKMVETPDGPVPGAYYHVSADWCADSGGEYALIGDLPVCTVTS